MLGHRLTAPFRMSQPNLLTTALRSDLAAAGFVQWNLEKLGIINTRMPKLLLVISHTPNFIRASTARMAGGSGVLPPPRSWTQGHEPPLPKLLIMAMQPSKTVSPMTIWKHLILSAPPCPHILGHLMDTDTGQGLSEVSDHTSQDQPKTCHSSPYFSTLNEAFPAKLRITYKKVVLTRV